MYKCFCGGSWRWVQCHMVLCLLAISQAEAISFNNPVEWNNVNANKMTKSNSEGIISSFTDSFLDGDLNAGFVVLGSFAVGLVVGGLTGSYVTAQQFKRVRRFRDDDDSDHKLSNSILLSEITDLDGCLETLESLENYHVTEYSSLLQSHQLLKDELLARDYEEFKVPDLNNDDVISYNEFVQHAANYKKGFPEATATDFPDFKAMDVNNDGEVTFDEWMRHVMQLKEESSGVES